MFMSGIESKKLNSFKVVIAIGLALNIKIQNFSNIDNLLFFREKNDTSSEASLRFFKYLGFAFIEFVNNKIITLTYRTDNYHTTND